MLQSFPRWFGAGTIGILLFGLAGGALAQTSALREFSAILPGGEGKILVFKYCVACHGVNAAWGRLEKGMWMSGAWDTLLEPAEIEPLARYLEENFGEDPRELSTAGQERLETLLPEGDGRSEILARCVACHEPGRTARTLAARAGLPGAAWQRILERMEAYGAPLTAEETERLSLYLSQRLAFGEGTGSVRERDSFLPEGPGKDLVLAHCLSCHGASELGRRLRNQSATSGFSWQEVVSRMREKWEALLDDEDEKEVVQYLQRYFPR